VMLPLLPHFVFPGTKDLRGWGALSQRGTDGLIRDL